MHIWRKRKAIELKLEKDLKKRIFERRKKNCRRNPFSKQRWGWKLSRLTKAVRKKTNEVKQIEAESNVSRKKMKWSETMAVKKKFRSEASTSRLPLVSSYPLSFAAEFLHIHNIVPEPETQHIPTHRHHLSLSDVRSSRPTNFPTEYNVIKSHMPPMFFESLGNSGTCFAICCCCFLWWRNCYGISTEFTWFGILPRRNIVRKRSETSIFDSHYI